MSGEPAAMRQHHTLGQCLRGEDGVVVIGTLAERSYVPGGVVWEPVIATRQSHQSKISS